MRARTRKLRHDKWASTGDLQELHRSLSRLDVEKDALQASEYIKPNHLPFFHHIADNLFGDLLVISYKRNGNTISARDSLQRSVILFNTLLQKHKAIRPRILQADNYTDLGRTFAALAPGITEAVHDCGISPRTINADIRIVLNPGSYIDPGSRTPYVDCDESVGFNEHPISLEALGFPNLQRFEAILNRDGSCQIQFVHRMKTHHFTFDSNYKTIFPYFHGNAVKNAWFNAMTTTREDVSYETGELYVLCKELGDTLQVAYAQQRNEYNGIRNKVCVFSNDMNVGLRSILMQVPACISKSSETGKKTFQYHPAMDDIAISWKKLEADAVEAHNQRSINDINQVLNYGGFYTQTDKYIRFTRTSPIANMLREAIQQIQQQTRIFMSKPADAMNLATYSKLASVYKASRLFNKRVLNVSNRATFVEYDGRTHIFPKPFPFIEQFMTGGGNLVGDGGVEVTEGIVPEYSVDKRQYDYTSPEPLEPETHLPPTYVLHGLYSLLRERFTTNEKSDIHLRYMTEDIHSKLVQFYGFTGTPMWSRDFLQLIISAYLDGSWQHITYSEFAALHKAESDRMDEADEFSWEWKLMEAYVEKPDYTQLLSMLHPLTHQQTATPTPTHTFAPTLISVKSPKTRKLRRNTYTPQ